MVLLLAQLARNNKNAIMTAIVDFIVPPIGAAPDTVFACYGDTIEGTAIQPLHFPLRLIKAIATSRCRSDELILPCIRFHDCALEKNPQKTRTTPLVLHAYAYLRQRKGHEKRKPLNVCTKFPLKG